MSVCLYSELESYSGSITHDPADLPRLVRDLKFACLFYDVVVIHRRNLWDHPLTLPAFELLEPFVSSGRLWASANEYDGAPERYVAGKIARFSDFFARAPRRERDALDALQDRWRQITPSVWPVHRCGELQSARMWQGIEGGLTEFKQARFRPFFPFLDWLENTRARQQFDKELMMAKLGALRDRLQPWHWAKLASLIQLEFLRVGAEFNNARIYPGMSRAYLINELLEAPPFARQEFENIRQGARKISLSLDQLLALPSQALFEINASEPWQSLRDALLDNRMEVDSQAEIRALLEPHQAFQGQVETLLANLPALSLTAPWSLSRQALLGDARACFSRAPKTKTMALFILDLACYLFYPDMEPARALRLKPQHSHLLAVLAIAGENGLLLEDIKQLFLELDWISWQRPGWRPHNQISEEEQVLLSDRIYHLRGQLNQQLQDFQLQISDRQGPGNWSLAHKNGSYSIKLASTAWELLLYSKDLPPVPPGLSKQQRLIWDCLWEHSPQLTDARVLAGVLGKEWNEKNAKQISDAVGKLDKKLAGLPWRIQRSYGGQYALLPAVFLGMDKKES